MILLVVYGHFIEAKMWDSEFLMWQYRLIYSVHMPLFAFLSGVFLKGKKACWMQFKKAFMYYLIFQALSIVIIKLVQGRTVSLMEPYWHLWYLLSLSCWSLLCLAVEVMEECLQGAWIKVILVMISIVFACMMGYVKEIDRTFSLSRTIVFLPYVLMGKYFPQETELKRYRIWGIMAGVSAIGLIIALNNSIPVSFLYQADSYMARGVEQGWLLRLLSYIIGVGMGFFLLVLIPQKRLPVSKIGGSTLWIYILHAPLVLLLQRVRFWENEFEYVAMFVAVILVLLLYKGFQWRGKLYRIV